jgi:arylsulfatase A-like enzyme
MATKPRNIIVLIADSLRYDSVSSTGVGLPYIQQRGRTFTEARSAGCWTLPATASIFTGLMPHEHGATEQTRGIRLDIPTLAEEMKKNGYKTYQVTANMATTDIFGLHRGFDEVRRIWKLVDPKFTRLQQFLVLIGKPRMRQKLFSKDLLAAQMSKDVEGAKTWLQHTFNDVFNECRKIIAENEARGERSFIFLNLMETHFPYHIAPTFELSTDGIYQKLREVVSLYHMVNQTFLTLGHQNIKNDMLNVLKLRQQTAWKALAPHVDSFCKELHDNTGNLVVFGADHGENFGESGWTYHFSNVTDAGNKVPLFWLDHETTTPATVTQQVSTRHLYHDLLRAAGSRVEGASLLNHPETSNVVLQSCWYNNHGKTLDQFKYNQICFLKDEQRFLWRNNAWYSAPMMTGYDEPAFAPLPKDADPLYDLAYNNPADKVRDLQILADFKNFASKISFA